MVEFLARETPDFIPPELLRADMVLKQFFISEPDEVDHRSRVALQQLTALVDIYLFQ